MASNEVRFDGKAILVTGGGRGMGREHALLLASRGAQVIVADNGTATDGSGTSATPAESVVKEIEAAGGTAVPCAEDLSTEEGASAAVQAAIDAFGRIDGLLHNASTSPASTPVEEISSSQLDLVMRINAYAGFWLTRAAWPHMKRQGGGRIAYTMSHAIYGGAQTGPYAAAKSAYIGMARAIALEGAPLNIFCNVLLPTARTRMTEQHFVKNDFTEWFFATFDPAKVSPGAAYLVSEDCTFNGEMFSFGGGRVARVRLAETQGAMNSAGSIEGVRDALEETMTQDDYFFPKDGFERMMIVYPSMGFNGSFSNPTTGEDSN